MTPIMGRPVHVPEIIDRLLEMGLHEYSDDGMGHCLTPTGKLTGLGIDYTEGGTQETRWRKSVLMMIKY